jgi:hypothetical protein
MLESLDRADDDRAFNHCPTSPAFQNPSEVIDLMPDP